MNRGQEFANLLYQTIILKRQHSLEALAEKVGMSYHSLHARLHAKTPLSADEIKSLIGYLEDPDLVDYFLEGTNLRAFKRSETNSDQSKSSSIFRDTNHLAIETANVLKAVEDSMVDNRIDHQDKAVILKEITAVERALARIRELLE